MGKNTAHIGVAHDSNSDLRARSRDRSRGASNGTEVKV